MPETVRSQLFIDWDPSGNLFLGTVFCGKKFRGQTQYITKIKYACQILEGKFHHYTEHHGWLIPKYGVCPKKSGTCEKDALWERVFENKWVQNLSVRWRDWCQGQNHYSICQQWRSCLDGVQNMQSGSCSDGCFGWRPCWTPGTTGKRESARERGRERVCDLRWMSQ